MLATDLSPVHFLPSGLCEDPSGEVATLIKRMVGTDPAALLELYNLWCPVLLGVACRMLGNPRDADKVVHDTFVHLWQGAGGYDPHKAPPFVWAFDIMRGFCIKRLRERRRGKCHVAHGPPNHPNPAAEKPDNPRIMPANDFRRVRVALELLSPEERSNLEQAVFLEFSPARGPNHIETHMGSVKNHLRQALKIVRNHLSRYEL